MEKNIIIRIASLLVFIILLSNLLPSCSNNSERNSLSASKYQQIETISITKNGQRYSVEAVSGQVIVIFKRTIKHSQAVKYIQNANGIIISQKGTVRYYLVDVGSGNVFSFINQIIIHPEIQFAYPNAVEYSCAVIPQISVIDNFYNSHGNDVTYTLRECGLNTRINTYNAGIKDDEKGRLSMSEINNNLLSILQNIPKNTPAVINMSFGPGFINDDVKYWTDKNITDDVKNSYVKHYKESLKNLIFISSFYKDKDFVIVKASGNEGLKKLDEEILIDLAKELSDDDFIILNNHFILAGAEDSRFPEYSNTISKGNYNFLYTSVDIADLKKDNANLYGTSFAAPRVSCFIGSAIEEYNIKATEALKAVKDITHKNPYQPITQDLLKKEAIIISENNKTQSAKNRQNSVSNKRINLAGTKWELVNSSSNSIFSFTRTVLEFQRNNQVKIINNFGTKGSEINIMYKYYFDTQNNKWIMYPTTSVSEYFNITEEEEKQFSLNIGAYYSFTITNNKLIAADGFGISIDEYKKIR
jgi:hypothetical protein